MPTAAQRHALDPIGIADSRDVHEQAIGLAQAQCSLAPLMSGRQSLLELGCILRID